MLKPTERRKIYIPQKNISLIMDSKMVDANNWAGLNYSDYELSIGYQFLSEIKKFVTAPFEVNNFHFIYDRCYRLFSGIPVCTMGIDEKAILRARRNFDGELFTHQYEISYNKQCPNKIALGRFNRPKESLFYGSLPLISKQASFLGTAVSECCKDLFDDLNVDMTFDFTIGLWTVKPFMAICLCLEDTHLNTNDKMKRVVSDFSQNISSNCNRLTGLFILECWRFLSELTTSKNKAAHLILTAWFCAIKEIYKDADFEVNGIVYPSSITDSKGLNIVLTPDAVDNYLHLEHVTMHRCNRWPTDRKQLDVFPTTEIVYVKQREFQFTNIGDKRQSIIPDKS